MPPIISNVIPFFVFSFEVVSTCNLRGDANQGRAA
jgi:hypothetical protein